MTTYLLDTDTCIYWLKGVSSVRERLLSMKLSNVAVSVITIAELYFGAYHSAKVDENIVRLEKFVQPITAIPLEPLIIATFGRLKALLRRQGEPLADFDLLIASTALAENRKLVTNNLRHYARVPSIQLENWLVEQ